MIRTIRIGVLLFAFYWFCSAAVAQTNVIVGQDSGFPGDVIQLPVQAPGDHSALQFDLLFDPAKLNFTGFTPAIPAAGEVIDFSLIEPGRVRVLLYSTRCPVEVPQKANPIKARAITNELGALTLQIAATASAGVETIEISNLVSVNAAGGLSSPGTLMPGEVTIRATPPVELREVPSLQIIGLWLLALLLMGCAFYWLRLNGAKAFVAVLSCGVLLLSTVETSYGIPGDANDDGAVDTNDLSLIVDLILGRGGVLADADCNEDGTVDARDLVCVLNLSCVQNQSPVIDSIPDQTVEVDNTLVIQASATDPDTGDTLTFSLTEAPSGMNIDPDSGLIEWIPGTADQGVHTVTVEVIDDDGLMATTSFIVTVTPAPNQPPVIEPVANQSVEAGNGLNVQVQASDPDVDDTLTFSLAQAPAGMSIDADTGLIAWTPGVADEGIHSVTVQVVDDEGLSDQTSFLVTVVLPDQNQPPSLTPISDITVIAGESLSQMAQATDLDPGDTLTFGLSVAPAGMNIDAASGLIEWTTQSADIGSHPVTVQVMDSNGATDTTSFIVTVIVPNQPPSLEPLPDAVVMVGDSYSVMVLANDPDLPSDTLLFSLPVAPVGMTIDALSGLIQWTPQPGDEGVHPVTVQVTDLAGAIATTSFQITVEQQNQAPVFEAIQDSSILVQQVFSVTASASDPDLPMDSLLYSIDQAPSGAVLDVQTGSLLWLPTSFQIGENTFVLRVTDEKGAFDTVSFVVTVTLPGGPPVLQSIADRQVTAGQSLTVNPIATDPDLPQDQLTYSLLLAPPGMTINPTSGQISWASNTGLIGEHDVNVQVMDLQGLFDTEHFIATVVGQNLAPEAADDVYQVNFGETLTIPAAGVLDNDIDPNGDPLSAALLTSPANGNLTLNGDGSFAYSPQVFGTTIEQNVNLTLLTLPQVVVSSSFSSFFVPERAIDGDLNTSWFTARPDPLSPNGFIELQFLGQITVKELQLFGNREFQSGFDFLSGKFELFDEAGNLLYESDDLALPDNGGTEPNRDLVHVVNPPVENVSRVRFTSSAIENPNGEAGLSEFHVIGDGIPQILEAEQQWSWLDSTDSLGVAISGDTETVPSVIDLDGDSIPEVIFNVESGHLLALNGQDGSPLFIVGGSGDPSRRVAAFATPAVGDIDNDGKPEIVIPASDTGLIKAFEHDGTLKWTSTRLRLGVNFGAVGIADLDADGSPEIITSAGSPNRGVEVLDAEGNIFWQSEQLGSGNNTYAAGMPVVADIDLDGSPDIVAGQTVYNADGTTKWHRDDLTDGYNAVGNFDADPYAEIVLVTNGEIYLLEHTGLTKLNSELVSRNRGGAPTVADFDSDGLAEIGVAGSTTYDVFEHDLTVKWSAPTTDGSSARTGSTVFDFQNDGLAEVVYSDERRLFVFRGIDGRVLLDVEARSTTGVEAPIVADVDNDGAAEIVAHASVDGPDQPAALFILRGVKDDWAATRTVWSEHAYSVTNINSDGSIPRYAQPNWLTPGLNSFRQNQFLPEERTTTVDSFTYRANDGSLNSNAATVSLQLLPINTAPEFTSIPIDISTAGFTYRYGASAVDAESDPISFALVEGPAGMTVEAATGLVEWSPAQADLGNHSVAIQVTDNRGFGNIQFYTLNVVLPVIVPNLIGDDQVNAEGKIVDGFLSVGQIGQQNHPTIPAGLVISQTPVAGNVAELGAPVSFVLSLGLSADDIDDDGDGFTENEGDCDDADALRNPARTEIPGNGIDENCDGLDVANATPVALDDSYLAVIGQTLSVAAPGVIQNDTDADGDALTATLVDDTQQGQLSLNANGSFTYLYQAEPALANLEFEAYCDFDTLLQYGTTPSQMALGDVDNDGESELVGVGGFPSGDGAGRLRMFVMDATTCTPEYIPDPSVVTDSGPFELTKVGQDQPLGLVDIDGDDDLEIVMFRSGGMTQPNGLLTGDPNGHLIAYHHDGSYAWNRTVPDTFEPRMGHLSELVRSDDVAIGFISDWRGSGPAVADLDADGNPELVMAFSARGPGNEKGVVAFNAEDGSIQWKWFDDTSTTRQPIREQGIYSIPIVADLDLDGSPEIVIDGYILNAQGELVAELNLLSLGATGPGSQHLSVISAVANLDNDAFGEILVKHRNHFVIFEHDGERKSVATYKTASSMLTSDLTLADFDGDGVLEIAHRVQNPTTSLTNRYIEVYELDGTLLWSHFEKPEYHNQTGALGNTTAGRVIAFDINQDGIDDIISNQRINSALNDPNLSPGIGVLFGFDGATGEELFRLRSPGQDAGLAPWVADLDQDGDAEILISGNNQFSSNGTLFIYTGSADNPLPPAPPVINQYHFNPAYVNLDGAVPENPTPHWLVQGLNGFNKVPTRIDVHQPPGILDQFTYRISDGAANSNVATVSLSVLPPMSSPVILSDPMTFATIDALYQYGVVAIDADPGDSLTYLLALAPGGMQIDSLTGLIRWNPGSSDSGDHLVRVVVQDSTGLASIQEYTLTVAPPVQVPDVVGQSLVQATNLLETASLQLGNVVEVFDATVPVGEVISQMPAAGSTVNNGSQVNLTLSKGPGPLDTDNDGDGFSENQGDCNDLNSNIFPGAADPIGDGIDQNCDGVDGDLTGATILIEPESVRLLAGQTQVLTAYAILPDQTSANITELGAWSSNDDSIATAAANLVIGQSAGQTTVQISHAGMTGSINVEVVATVTDTQQPVAEILNPEANSTITQPVDIVGTANDNNFFSYVLEIASAGEDNFTEIASGDSPIDNGVLGQFDPTLLLNDLYTVRLSVIDTAGNMTVDEIVYQVDEDMKIGNFSLTFVDLSIPMSGIPITVNRTYDSRDKRLGDFGVGWRLSVQTLTCRANRVLGTGWQVVKSGLSFQLIPTDAHKVSLVLPNGRVEEFDMVVSPTASPFIPFPPFGNRASFRPRPGTLGTLRSLDNNNLTILDPQPGEISLLDDSTNQVYNPKRFLYTQSDGTEILIHKDSGVQSIKEPNGNTLTFTADGIFHSAGKQALFERDELGRIIKLIDPNGNEQLYQYDGNGDLTGHTDQEGNLTTFRYNYQHGLLEIIDPLGRVVGRNEYDDDGRLISVTNVDGRTITFGHDVDLQQEVITDADGSVTVLEYDAMGNLVRLVDSLGSVTQHTYDAEGNRLTTTNAENETVTRTFDLRNNLLSQTDSLGNVTQYSYNSQDKITSITDPMGRTTYYTYDARGNVQSQTDALGNVQTKVYDDEGNLLVETDQLGQSIQHEYDASGQRVASTDARGYRQTFIYDDNGRILGNTNRRGFSMNATVDSRGLTTSITDLEGQVTQLVYNELGLLNSVTNALGNVIQVEVDAEGKELASIDGMGQRTERRYDIKGNMTEVITPDGRISRIEYDVLGRLTALVPIDGNALHTSYDGVGRVTSETDQRGNITQYQYDAAGQRSQATNPLSEIVTYEYDAAGNQVKGIDALGNEFNAIYDDLNRRVRTIYPDGSAQEVTYDARGQVVAATDALGRSIRFAYDANGNLTTITDPLGEKTQYSYDAENNLILRIDGNGHATAFAYDGNNRQIRKTYPDGSAESNTYDAAGNVTSKTDASGNTTLFEYDANQRLVKAVYADGSEILYTYTTLNGLKTITDNRGVTSYAYDQMERLVRVDNPDGSSLEYSYDEAGNLLTTTSQVSVAAAPNSISKSYDVLNRLSTVTDQSGSMTSYSYDANGNRVGVEYPNGTRTAYRYDSLNRLIQIQHWDDSAIFEQLDYTLNAAGERVRIDYLDGRTTDYEYDSLSRLISEVQRDTSSLVTLHYRYTYDAVGNRLTKTDQLSGLTENYTYDSNDRLLQRGDSIYTYDANGNLVSEQLDGELTTYTYDVRDRLIEHTVNDISVVYTYDDAANRISKTDESGTTQYLVDSNNNTRYSQVIEEYGASEASYVYGDDLISQLRSESVSYYHYDGTNSVRLLSDTAGTVTDTYTYDAFGTVILRSGSTENNYLFSGEQFDANTGFYYLRARYYAPEQGRFISRDPFQGFTQDPVSLHKYLYARNNPLSFNDPSGRVVTAFGLTELQTAILVGGVVSAAITSGFIIKDAFDPAKLSALTNGSVIYRIFTSFVVGAIGGALSFGASSVVGPVASAATSVAEKIAAVFTFGVTYGMTSIAFGTVTSIQCVLDGYVLGASEDCVLKGAIAAGIFVAFGAAEPLLGGLLKKFSEKLSQGPIDEIAAAIANNLGGLIQEEIYRYLPSADQREEVARNLSRGTPEEDDVARIAREF